MIPPQAERGERGVGVRAEAGGGAALRQRARHGRPARRLALHAAPAQQAARGRAPEVSAGRAASCVRCVRCCFDYRSVFEPRADLYAPK